MATQQRALDSTRAALMAVRSAAGIARGTGTAARLIRTAEGLLRSAVSELLGPLARDGKPPVAAQAHGAKTAAAAAKRPLGQPEKPTRRRTRRSKEPTNSMHVDSKDLNMKVADGSDRAPAAAQSVTEASQSSMAATDAGDDANPVVLLVRLLSELHEQWLASPPPRVEVAIGAMGKLLRMAQMLDWLYC